MNPLITHAAVAPVAVGAPLLVVACVAAVARRSVPHLWRQRHVATRSTALAVATVVALVGVGAWMALDGAAITAGHREVELKAAKFGLFAVLFAGLAMPTLHAIGRAVRETHRHSPAPQRSASLAPRTSFAFLPLPAQALPYLLVAASMVPLMVRLADGPLQERQHLGVSFLAAAVVLVVLYTAWIKQAARHPQAISSGDDELTVVQTRRATVRRIHRLQIVLAVGLGVGGNTMTWLDWFVPAQANIGVAVLVLSTVLSMIGCAFAFTSDLAKSPLRPGRPAASH